MKTGLFFFLVILAPMMEVSGDIAPNPIKAKGIIAPGSTDVILKWERVSVDLYKDSSVVECQFFLENNGKSQKVNIGFPEMNFYHFNLKAGNQIPGDFVVHENGEKVTDIKLYKPDNQINYPENGVQQNIVSMDNYSQKPWILWDSQFGENSTKLVTVRYSLPNGTIRNRCRYFTYLLSTGSGWKGKIDSAAIIVNLKDIDYELVLQATPVVYSRNKNQLKWMFTEFEPTTESDIRIMYEPAKGYYESALAKNPSPVWILDGIKVVGAWGMLEPQDVASIKVLKDPNEKAKYSDGNEDIMLVTGKDYAIRQFIEQIASKKLKSGEIKYLPNSLFVVKYDLKIDGEYFEGTKMFQQLPEIVPESIREVRLVNPDSSRTTISLTTRKGKKK